MHGEGGEELSLEELESEDEFVGMGRDVGGWEIGMVSQGDLGVEAAREIER